jgi:hypothetical protein
MLKWDKTLGGQERSYKVSYERKSIDSWSKEDENVAY